MPFLFQIQIPRRNQRCSECEKSFAEGEKILSTLQEEKGGWIRKDGCINCVSPNNEGIRWISRHKEIDKGKPTDEGEKGWNLLLQMVKEKEFQKEEELFILALYLIRKKILIERKNPFKKEDRLWILCEHSESGEMIFIPKLDLAGLNLPAIQAQIKTRLAT